MGHSGRWSRRHPGRPRLRRRRRRSGPADGLDGKAGHRLKQDAGGSWLCPETGSRYEEIDGQLLPAEMG